MSIWLDILVQPALVGGMVLMKDILYDHYLPESPHLWIDVGLHVVSKIVSTGITQELLVPNIGPMMLVVDPLIHGGLTGLAKEHLLDTENITALSLFNSGKVPLPHYYKFSTGFTEGLVYGGIATGIGYGIDSAVDKSE
jgi:hypothetical protein